MLSNWSKKCSNYFELLHTVSGKEYIILIRPIYFFCRLGFIARNFRFRWIQSPDQLRNEMVAEVKRLGHVSLMISLTLLELTCTT
ncbi:hypothetical protein DEO72_LG3g2375 [Vigna unguiculata]|uniref:Uncharacterized protein n=1 Tax=Vigna unguiculata TaxID=3917 RepID=A0A4D6LHM4_VIGUN|nr:hypothetical protein DEO72_LG3g2375 [Vigna unguiculata]